MTLKVFLIFSIMFYGENIEVLVFFSVLSKIILEHILRI